MFILTMRWSRKTAALAIVAAAVLLAALILLLGRTGAPASGAMDTSEGRVQFLQSLGWQVDASSEQEKAIVIPQEFSAVYEEYNRLQLAQGYDLSQYKGLEATVYTYTLLNYEGYVGTVVADVYVRGGECIGGDIHCLALDGFMHGLRR